MLKYLQDSESKKVSTRELGQQLLSNESRVNVVRIASKPGRRSKKSYFTSSGKEKVPARRDGMFNGRAW